MPEGWVQAQPNFPEVGYFGWQNGEEYMPGAYSVQFMDGLLQVGDGCFGGQIPVIEAGGNKEKGVLGRNRDLS